MNGKRGQNSPSVFTIIVFVIIFIMLMGSGLGYFLSSSIAIAVNSGVLSGMELALYMLLPVFIVFFFGVAVLFWGLQ